MRIEGILIILLTVLCLLFPGGQSTYAYADNSSTFDNVNVLDDLRSSTSDGKAFDLKKYPFNDKGSVAIVNFVEYCYSFKSNMRGNYGLYVYVYNPQGLTFDTTVKQNKIQMAVAYDNNGTPTRYEKFELKYCNKSEESNYKNLFYKFKVIDRKINDKTFVDRVNSNERRYDVSGIELTTKGNPNATEYGVGGTYKFTGYAKGYGPDTTAESNLTCVVENLETLELNVHHTYYRTNVSSLGKNHYNEVNTVYFSVPERIFTTYGFLQKIRAEWWEYKTKRAMVTSDRDFYNLVKQCTGYYVGEHSDDVPFCLYTDFFPVISAQWGSPSIYQYGWTYNVNLETVYTIINTVQSISSSDSISEIMPYAFYSPAADVDSIFKFLYSKPIAGDVNSTEVANWIYNYQNNLGHGYIDCNGREISKDLFEDTVDEGRTKGYNDKTIDLSDTFNLMSYDSNHSWWDKLWDYGFSWPTTSGDYQNVEPIYTLQASDLTGTNSAISTRLLVNEDDVNDLRTYYTAETLKGNRVILFRFATTDYYCAPAYRTGMPGTINNTDTYVAQETVFFDFDIIELTFNKDGVYHVIPVVSSPTDIINGFTAPPVKFQWWKILVAILLLILLLILLWPLLPHILRAIWYVITLPFKLIGKAIERHRLKKIEKAVKKEDEG